MNGYHCARCGRAGHLPIDCPWSLALRWLVILVLSLALGAVPSLMGLA